MIKKNMILLYCKTKTLGLISKFCKVMRKTIVYESKTGYKEINPIRVDKVIEPIKHLSLSTEYLFLGIDCLKDKYTLVDTPIRLSPHYGLVEAIANNEELKETDYVQRMFCGALDDRYEIIAFYLNPSHFYDSYNRSEEKISNPHNDEIIIYEFSGKYYIYDGKHRAALCALRGIEAKCVLIDAKTVFARYNQKKVRKMMQSRNYVKHSKFFN